MRLLKNLHILSIFSAMSLTLGLGACSMVEDNPLDCPVYPASPSDSIMLSFKLISSNIGTRADNYHPEIGSSWK